MWLKVTSTDLSDRYGAFDRTTAALASSILCDLGAISEYDRH